ncbi:hypothetical protein HK104_004572 [Borealophlyctis nickersoniae]|nr:hypothetical protein HK104_004572 [Borealophlyctis nickersoniae]
MSGETDWDLWAAMGLPTGFGKKAKDNSARDQRAIEETRRAPADVPKTGTNSGGGSRKGTTPANVAEDEEEKEEDSDVKVAGTGADDEITSGSEEEDEEDEEEGYDDGADRLPISHQATLKDHMKTVSALSIDAAGSRFATGGRDCMVKLWDFNGMDASLRPFRSLEPSSGNPVRDVQFSMSGDQFLVASTSSQVKLYDRDGLEIAEYVKGDPYIRDMRHTKGHIAALTGCRWHPHDKKTFITSSLDSTIRIWDAETKRTQKQVIAVKSKLPGGRTAITSIAFSPDGKLIVGGAADGALRIWKSSGPFLQPSQTMEGAHMSGAAISSVAFSVDNVTLATRGMDDTLKLWDIRKFTKPLASATGLLNFFEETNVTFSPNDRYILTGTSVKKDEGPGKMCVFEKQTLKKVEEVEVGRSSVARVLWHGRINQIVAGTGDGSVQVLYDPKVSLAGIKVAVVKQPKRRGMDVDLYTDDAARPIITPHALPMFKEDIPGTGKRKREKMRTDPMKSKKPDMPITGPGRGGKVGTNLTQHIMRSKLKNTMRDEDPREAILRHAEEAAADPYWVAPAYKKNQPKPVLAESVFEDEEEALRSEKKRRQ